MAAPTPVLTTPSGATALPFTPAGTWSGTGKLSKLRFQVRKASASDWEKPVIDRTKWRAGITGNQSWSFSLPAADRARLKRGVSYQARVKVWNHAGVASGYSSAKTFTVTADDPTVTLNTLTEESDGHTPLEALVFTGTLGADSSLEPASLKLEVFESQSGDLKFSQMHAISTEERETGEWSIPYIGPDLRARQFLAGDPIEVLGVQELTTSTGGALTIPEGTTGIIVTFSEGFPIIGTLNIGGVEPDDFYWSNAPTMDTEGRSSIAVFEDISARSGDTISWNGTVLWAEVIYIGGNNVSFVAHENSGLGPNTSYDFTSGVGPHGGNIIMAVAEHTHQLFGAYVTLDGDTTVTLDTGLVGQRYYMAGYKVGGPGGSVTITAAVVGGAPNNWLNGAVAAWVEGLPDFDGLYDIKVTIYDSAGGTASVTGSEYMHIYRELLDDETTADLTTGLSNIRPTQRILIRDMKANRGPGKVIGILEDARNIGVSRYATSPGELYFTLQSLHPQISIIEPFATHYEYQQYRRGRWVSLEYGIFVDFDATEDEVVFYGMDYLGLLSVSIEGAHQIAKSPNKQISTKHNVLSGSRYKKRSIRYIIKNQLQRARFQETHSPVRFIKVGTLDKMQTKVTIFASHVERLAFIRGLIESHKGGQVNGQERRTRMRVRYRRSKQDFAFELLDNKGTDKDALRLEFGGLVQGYRIVAYDDYRNKVYAIGVKPNASKPFFLNKVAQGVTLSDWGVWGKAEMHGDIVDKKDLARRARASANHMSRPGKSVALGIRVRAIDYCDGYDVLDSVPIDIVDNAIDTNNFGGGYWTIWGINYRVFEDEHDELTWILRPKGDSDDFDPDLITSEPEPISSEWAWGSGEPTP